MIVTCEECSTSFELDESRIPPTGARVRCSRCKHAFFLRNPAASESQAAHSIAEEAAADSAAGVPPASGDLADDAAPAQAASPEPEEEDWQFSEEVRVAGDDDPDDDARAAGIPDDSDFGAQGEIGGGFDPNDLSHEISASGLEMGGLAEPEVEAAAAADEGVGSGLELDGPSAPLPPEPQRDESSFGTVDDFSSLMQDEDSSSADLDQAAASAPVDLATSQASGPVGSYAEKGATDDLGEPESWDLVGGDDFGGVKPSVAGASRSFSNPLGDAGSYAESLFGQDSDALAYPEEAAERSRLLRLLAAAGKGVGWVVTLVAVGALLWLGLRPEWQRWVQAPQQASLGPIVAETDAAGWVETSRAGFLLTISGRVRNESSQATWPGRIQLALLDAAGERLTTPALTAGVMLPSHLLRESSPAQLEATLEQAQRRFLASPLAPGEVRTFQAIVPERSLPDRARRLLLELGEPTTAPRAASAAAVNAVSAASARPAQLDEGSLPSP